MSPNTGESVMVDLSLFVRRNDHPECVETHRYLAAHPLGRVTYHASHDEAVKAIAASVEAERARRKPAEPDPEAEWRLVFDPSICKTSPLVRGTLVTAAQVVALVVDGFTWDDILYIHPALTEDDIRACLAYTVEQQERKKGGA